jgi:hypothetical protein
MAHHTGITRDRGLAEIRPRGQKRLSGHVGMAHDKTILLKTISQVRRA